MNDGDFYRNIRRFQMDANADLEILWMSKLSPHKRKYLTKFCQVERFESLREKFDRLLIITGLWIDMRLSTLHKLLTLFSKCPEEINNYLDHIYHTWSRILHHDVTKLQKVDTATVRKLQLRCPKYSKADADLLRYEMESREAFSKFDVRERGSIWGDLLEIDYLIPSFFTLFEDLKYLESCAESMRSIIEEPKQCFPIKASLRANFPQPSGRPWQCEIETGQGIFALKEYPPEQQFGFVEKQLWLCCMRDYSRLPLPLQKKQGLLAKAGREKAKEGTLLRFAKLAHRLGVRNKKIEALLLKSNGAQRLRAVMVEVLKPDRNRCWDFINSVLKESDEILEATTTSHQRRQSASRLACPTATTLKCRCGYPKLEHHMIDRKLLYLENMYGEAPAQYMTQNGEITSFFVRRCVFRAFWVTDRGELYPSVEEGSDWDSMALSEGAMDLIRPTSPTRSATLTPGLPDMTGDPPAAQEVPVPEVQQEIAYREERISKGEILGLARRHVLFLTYYESQWRVASQVPLGPNAQSEVEKTAKTCIESGALPYSILLVPILATECYNAARSSGRNVVLLMDIHNVRIDDELRRAVSELLSSDEN
ncbi:hypothetical protein PGQ11_007691 [Apiospora arundinis]|uniref:Uncharacterized protein n=1 Tax=Apiospora arundinis TaxID=335852 RepID=A0ABR2IW99_9PEZI